MGINLGPDDWAIRCNLVHVDRRQMRDFTAGHITSEDGQRADRGAPAGARRPAGRRRHARVPPRRQYRNILVYRGAARPSPFAAETKTQPPHDIPTGRRRPPAAGAGRRPAGATDGARASRSSPTTRSTRRASPTGKKPATQIWLWGQGKAPTVAAVRARRTASAGRSSAPSIWSAASACCSAGTASTCPGRPAISTPTTPPRAATASRPWRTHDLVCVHVEAPGRGVARGQGRREGEGPGADRRAHRRPAAGGAAEATATGASWSRRTTARRCDPGPRLRGGAVRRRRHRHRRRGASRATTSRPPPRASLSSTRAGTLMRWFLGQAEG